MNIFRNPYTGTETWSSQGALVQWGTGDAATKQFPLMMLKLDMQYQRSLSSFYPINPDTAGNLTKYNIAGAPKGTLSVSSIYGPTIQGLNDFLEAVTRGCVLAEDAVTISILPFGNLNCTPDGRVSDPDNPELMANQWFVLSGVEMESIALSITGGEAAIVNLPQTYSFTMLEIITM